MQTKLIFIGVFAMILTVSVLMASIINKEDDRRD